MFPEKNDLQIFFDYYDENPANRTNILFKKKLITVSSEIARIIHIWMLHFIHKISK